MKPILYLSLAAAIFLATACDSEDSNDRPATVVPEHQLKALEKAKDVEIILKEGNEKRKQEMEY